MRWTLRFWLILLGLGALFYAFLWILWSYYLRLEPQQEFWSIHLSDMKWDLLTSKWLPGWYMDAWTGSLDTRLIELIISVEDRRFYDHSGVDMYGKIGSLLENIKAGKIVRGGSTITEQYIKNAYFPGEKRTIWQKIKEGGTALVMEQRRSKDAILRSYLNSLYFWENLYGLSAIIEAYGWQNNLSDDDIIDIATLIKYPNITENNSAKVMEYRTLLWKRFALWSDETGLYDIRAKKSFDRFPLVTRRIMKMIDVYCQDKNPKELIKWVKDEVPKDICDGWTKRLQLSIDANLMEYTRLTLESVLQGMKEKNVTNGAVYIYSPRDNKVLAYIWSRSSTSNKSSEIDMIQEKRSVGSILKPFVFLAALELWYDGNEFILDDTKTYPTGQGTKVFVPMNYTEKPFWPIRLSEALGNSLNSSTVRLTEELGIGQVYSTFQRFWLELDHDSGYYGYSLVLGWPELTLENIVESYTKLVNTSDANLFLLANILKDPMNRAKTFGVSSILGTSLPLPVKTWTSTEFRDNWTVSYDPSAVIGVWVGNSDNSSMLDVSGVSGAWPIWHNLAEYMIARGMIVKHPQKIPPSIKEIAYCLDSRCVRQDLRYGKDGTTQKSRPLDRLFYEWDFVTRLTEEEMEKWKIERK